MIVFYSVYDNSGTRDFCFTELFSNVIIDEIDLSYWAVPGTLE